jgi:L-iditol 2-dehydrogenase
VRVSVLRAAGDLAVEERPDPLPGPHEVLIRVASVGVCGSVGLWACRRGEVTAGSRVLVTGAGPVGLVTAQCALALGASEVTVTDVNRHRLQLAGELGVTTTVDLGTISLAGSGVEPDVLLECSGRPEAVIDAIPTVARAGRVVLVGMGADELPLPVSRIQEYELTVTGTFRYAHTWPAAISLASTGRVQLDRLVTAHYGLDQVREALTANRNDAKTVKPMVRPGS